ncbi:MAG TPA: hypothetical protein VLK82_25460 [Candidatus Tectomicrobia bacterium]|nr:hypothetical protein [Candidatus Tectomicrobia bacterium]
MNMPRFTAEAGLYETSGQYWQGPTATSGWQGVVELALPARQKCLIGWLGCTAGCIIEHDDPLLELFCSDPCDAILSLCQDYPDWPAPL